MAKKELHIEISPTGEVAATWRNWLGGSRDLFMATSLDGRSFSEAQKLGTGTWKLDACPMDGGSIAFAPAGKWLAVWRRNSTVLVSAPDLPEKQLATNAAQPVVAYLGKAPLILWETGGGISLQRGAEPPMRFADHARSPSIAGGPNSAVVAWESGATCNGNRGRSFTRPHRLFTNSRSH